MFLRAIRAVMYCRDKNFGTEYVTMPVPRKHELLILLAAVGDGQAKLGSIGNCRLSDGSIASARHTATGVVVELGAEVTKFEEGDVVETIWLQNICLRCEFFETGWGGRCDHQRY